MTFVDFIQNIATGGAALLGITYLIGGLIVNLNLSRRGVVEYQVLKVKYLAVGMIFLFHLVGIVAVTSLPAFLVFIYVRNYVLIQFTSILSILGSLVLLYVWTRHPSNTKSAVGTAWFWAINAVLTLFFPMLMLFYEIFAPRGGLERASNLILAVLVVALGVVAQIYHYSAFYYGRPSSIRTLDPIGMGIPTRVNLLCDEKYASALSELGLPIQKNIIRDVYLIDETDVHYMVGTAQVPGGDGKGETYKIDKSLVKVILHKSGPLEKAVEIQERETKKRSPKG